MSYIDDFAEAVGLPVAMLTGRGMDERTARIYYRTLNAALKGTKRRVRRHIAYVRKMLRKGKFDARHLSR